MPECRPLMRNDLLRLLALYDACRESVLWVLSHPPDTHAADLWDTCDRPDWLTWLADAAAESAQDWTIAGMGTYHDQLGSTAHQVRADIRWDVIEPYLVAAYERRYGQ